MPAACNNYAKSFPSGYTISYFIEIFFFFLRSAVSYHNLSSIQKYGRMFRDSSIQVVTSEPMIIKLSSPNRFKKLIIIRKTQDIIVWTIQNTEIHSRG